MACEYRADWTSSTLEDAEDVNPTKRGKQISSCASGGLPPLDH